MANPYLPYEPPAAADTAPVASGQTSVSDTVVQLLVQTRPWVMMMAVTLFTFLGICVLAALGLMLPTGTNGPAREFASILPLALMAAIYVPAALFLLKFAGNIQQLQKGGGQAALESALRNQKSFWKYVGIFASVTLGLMVIATVTTFLFGLLGRRGG